MKSPLIIVASLIAFTCLADEQVPYYKTEAFQKQYEAKMRQYVANREKKIEEVKKSFHSEILPAIEKLKPKLELEALTEREDDWPSEFEKYGIRFVILKDDQIRLFLNTWVSKAEILVYYFDPLTAPKEEDTIAENEEEKKRPNPERLKIFDDLWYWSFRS